MHKNWMGNLVQYFLCFMTAWTSISTMARVMAVARAISGTHSGGYPFSRISLNEGAGSPIPRD